MIDRHRCQVARPDKVSSALCLKDRKDGPDRQSIVCTLHDGPIERVLVIVSELVR